jgi:23S rRNA (pseudouridine1915-N3)-methyltransferase
MKIGLVVIGKTDDKFIAEGLKKYQNRLKHYISFEYIELPDVKRNKNLSQEQQKKMEGISLLNIIKPGDYVVLLDEKGKTFSSREFAAFTEKRMVAGTKRMLFIIGGPYGFSDEIYRVANDKVSLSKMTFSHQLVRLIFFEQLYRAMTILKNEPYHHD